ncbi:radical SAM protein [Candidatus Hydrogenedentota bacterium]
MSAFEQLNLFGTGEKAVSLPTNYRSVPPEHFHVEHIILAKGSLTTPEREAFVRRICAVLAGIPVDERMDIPHNRFDVGTGDSLERHQTGKKTLVLGEHKSAVRFSDEEGNTCPNYWHFSPYGFCPYGCKYCYLAGTRGVWPFPAVKIFVNLPEILSEVARVACKLGRPTAFYMGKLQDGLALDSLTGYSRILASFFREHPFARQIILTKSASVTNLIDLDHGGHTILSWSLNPPEISEEFEENVPSVAERLTAMKKCSEKGYPVRAVLMPIIPVENWREVYAAFLRRFLERMPVQRLTLGGVCSYRNAMELMERKTGKDNLISTHMRKSNEKADGRVRYDRQLRIEMYSYLIDLARETSPNTELALCLEEMRVWETLGLESRLGKCNCVL